jgi:hypothetical protein
MLRLKEEYGTSIQAAGAAIAGEGPDSGRKG